MNSVFVAAATAIYPPFSLDSLAFVTIAVK